LSINLEYGAQGTAQRSPGNTEENTRKNDEKRGKSAPGDVVNQAKLRSYGEGDQNAEGAAASEGGKRALLTVRNSAIRSPAEAKPAIKGSAVRR
jgi:hypothetical protein